MLRYKDMFKQSLPDSWLFCWQKENVEDKIIEQPGQIFEKMKGLLSDGLRTHHTIAQSTYQHLTAIRRVYAQQHFGSIIIPGSK